MFKLDKTRKRGIVHMENLSWIDKMSRVAGELEMLQSNRALMKQRNRFMRQLGISPRSDEAHDLDIIMAYEFLKNGQAIDFEHDGIWPQQELGEFRQLADIRFNKNNSDNKNTPRIPSPKKASTLVFRTLDAADHFLKIGFRSFGDGIKQFKSSRKSKK